MKPGGSDLNSGLDDANAWATITKVNSALANGTIDAGDQVVFKRDGTYPGRINLDGKTGIVFDGYGTGSAKPVISGAIAISSWGVVPVAVSGGYRWSADVPGSYVQVYGVFQGTARQTLAREPDAGWFFIDSWTSSSLTDTDLGSTGIDWTGGGQAVIRTSNWRYDAVSCTGQTGNTIDFSAINLPGNPPPTGIYTWGYFLQNELDAADTPGEWFYELVAGQGRLHFVTSDGTNAPADVEVAVYDRCMDIRRSTNITVQNLAFTRTRLGIKPYGDYGAGSTEYPVSGVIVDHCDFNQLFRGIDDDSNPGFESNFGHTYSWNVFDEVGDAAIWTSATNCSVHDNTATNCGLWPGWGTNAWGYVGIRSIGNGATVENNSLSDIGYAGIAVEGTGSTVRQNYLLRAMKTLNDGGGIVMDKSEALLIEDNIVADMVGNTESTATNYPANEPITTGIYFGDQHLLNVTARHNTVWGCGTGMYVDHNHDNASTEVGQKHRIEHNTLFGNTYAQLSMSDNSNYRTGQPWAQGVGGPNFVPAYPDEYRGNILYSLRSEQRCMTQESVWAPVSSALVDFGKLEGNHYFNPFNPVAIFQSYKYSRAGVETYLPRREKAWSLNGWRDRFNEEISGTRSPLRTTDYAIQSLGTANTALTQDLNASSWLTPWSASSATPEPTFPAFANGVEGLRLTNGNWLENWGSGYVEDAASMHAEASTWLATYRLKSDNTDMIGVVPLWSNSTGQLLSVQYADLLPDWKEYSFVFDVPNNGAVDVVNILSNVHWGTGPAFVNTSTIDLDWTKFEPCTLVTDYYAQQVAPYHILRYYADLPGITGDDNNVSASNGSFNVPSIGNCWSDVEGNFYAAGQELTLEPWQSIILFRFDPPQTMGAANTETHIASGTTTWSENRNILGRYVVDDGATLVIDGAHIGFAASTPQFANNITVLPGGTLELKNGATLRNWMGCDEPAAMWDGVKVLGTGNTAGAGMLVLESGGRISHAHTAARTDDGSPTNPLVPGTSTSSGGVVQCTNGIFENNMYDVAFLPHGDIDPIDWGPSFFTNTTFGRSAPLLSGQNGGVHVSLLNAAATEFIGCTWANTTGANPTTPSGWGMGVQAIETRIRIADSEDGTVRSKISGLNSGVLHSSYTPAATADIDGCDFIGNARGALLYGSTGSRIVNSTFQVPDLPVNDLEVAAAYGSYLYGCSGFEVEENTYTGIGGTDHPKVGAIFRSTGNDNNQFSRNSFNGFAGAGISAGNIIMGNNGGVSATDGLHWRCNQYSNTGVNDHDVAFTGEGVIGVTIGQNQGSNMDPTTPAANTFANFDDACGDGTNDNGERHLYVHPDAVTSLNVFEYWHHVDIASTEYRPHCDTDPPIIVSVNPAVSWIKQSAYDFIADACPVDLSRDQDITDVLTELEEVAAEHKELAEVYGDWTDGGNTAGLKDYILDPANSSYAVRNRLMLVAPKVSHENWEHAFFRTPALDPWHLAQALIANSPLPLKTVLLLDSSLVNPYFKQLVRNAQDGSMSMHTIYQSELSYLYGRASNAAYTAVDLVRRDAAHIDDALDILDATKLENKERLALALWLAKGDRSTAYALIDSMRTARSGDGYWAVQGMFMDLGVQDLGPGDIDATGLVALEQIAENEKDGCGQARAWLLLLNEAFTEPIVLPTLVKRARAHAQAEAPHAWHPLAVFPNPATGPVTIVYEVPDAVADAQVRVMDALGKLVYQERVSGMSLVQLDLAKPASGLHIIGLYYDGQLVATEKVQLGR